MNKVTSEQSDQSNGCSSSNRRKGSETKTAVFHAHQAQSLSTMKDMEDEFAAMTRTALRNFDDQQLKRENERLKAQLAQAEKEMDAQAKRIKYLESFRFGFESLRVIRDMEAAASGISDGGHINSATLGSVASTDWKISLTPREFNKLCMAVQATAKRQATET